MANLPPIPSHEKIEAAAPVLGVEAKYLLAIFRGQQKPGAALTLRIHDLFPRWKPSMLRPDYYPPPKQKEIA